MDAYFVYAFCLIGMSVYLPVLHSFFFLKERKQALLCLSFFFFLINLFILFLAALGLRCCARAFSSCGERGLLFVAVRGLLIAVASLVAEHRL